MSENAISEEEKASRHKIVDEAIHSQRLAGGDVIEEVQRDMRLWAEGLMTIEEVKARIPDALARAKAGRPHTEADGE